jgi:hypothetical protein
VMSSSPWRRLGEGKILEGSFAGARQGGLLTEGIKEGRGAPIWKGIRVGLVAAGTHAVLVLVRRRRR